MRWTRGDITLAHEANCEAMIAAASAWVAYCWGRSFMRSLYGVLAGG
ncbi:hypothetical protein [Lysobacter gummosus]